MPWSGKQHRLFEAAGHDPEIAREHGLSQAEARKLADEGVKHKSQNPGGDTDVENDEAAMRRAKHAAGSGFFDLAPVFGFTGPSFTAKTCSCGHGASCACAPGCSCGCNDRSLPNG